MLLTAGVRHVLALAKGRQGADLGENVEGV